jgi:hypothetical protein
MYVDAGDSGDPPTIYWIDGKRFYSSVLKPVPAPVATPIPGTSARPSVRPTARPSGSAGATVQPSASGG